MNGITYYRLKSDYTGDYTKNCALNGTEVDNNFYVLEGRDVKSISVNDKDIVVTLINGDTVTAQGVLDFVKPEDISTSVINVEFDKLNGILTLTNADGTIQTIEGFATNENTDFSVSTDNTLFGEGLRGAPLGVAPSYRTGQYKTVKSIINVAEGGSLPSKGNVLGDRYVTCEDISDYGYLYDYRAVREIASELKETGWRIPTKEDWDDLLNAVEPCDCDKNHEKSDKNKFLGKWAGKLLKSKTMWNSGCCVDSCGDCDGCSKKKSCGCESECNCGQDTCIDYSDDPCINTKESETDCKCEKDCKYDHIGLDAFGFRVTPTGYADDGCNYSYFKERAAFWTATTNESNSKAYIKRFQYNKDGVYQDVIASNYHLSLRLIKDYNGKNYFDVEEIMDMEYPTLLLPSVAHGKSIWLAADFACSNASLNPMIPNDGEGLTYTRHYFINEWDGFRWVRNEMKQGDTVTVAKSPQGKTMVEYRVIGDNFVSVGEMIYNDVMDDVQLIIDNLKETIDKEIKEDLDAEISVREETDKQLNETIATVNTNLVTAINTINAGIESERIIREEADIKLQKNIDSEVEERKVGDEKLEETIKTVNANLITSIDTINKNVSNGFTAVNTAIEVERVTRANADKAIEGKVLTEEGTEFNENTGTLTLKSANGTNDITVQMSFNFGEF